MKRKFKTFKEASCFARTNAAAEKHSILIFRDGDYFVVDIPNKIANEVDEKKPTFSFVSVIKKYIEYKNNRANRKDNHLTNKQGCFVDNVPYNRYNLIRDLLNDIRAPAEQPSGVYIIGDGGDSWRNRIGFEFDRTKKRSALEDLRNTIKDIILSIMKDDKEINETLSRFLQNDIWNDKALILMAERILDAKGDKVTEFVLDAIDRTKH